LQGYKLLDLVAPFVDLFEPAVTVVFCLYKAFGLHPGSAGAGEGSTGGIFVFKGMLYAPRGQAVRVLCDLVVFHALVGIGVVHGGPVAAFCQRVGGQAAPVIIGMLVILYSSRRGYYGATLFPDALRGSPGLPAGLRVVFGRVARRGVGGDAR